MGKADTPQDQNGLERSVSLFQATVYGVGIILGAGIYALIGEAAGIAGNAIWVSFIITALIATCSAISYAELSAIYPKSAAEFVYVKEISGSTFLGFVVGYVTVVTGIIAVAAVSLGFSNYFKLYLDTDPVLVAIVLILAVATLNFSGIQQSAWVNTLLTFVVAVSVVPAEALYAASKFDNPSEGPLAQVASTALHSPMGGNLFTVIALCATANTVLVLHIVTSRMLYGDVADLSLQKPQFRKSETYFGVAGT